MSNSNISSMGTVSQLLSRARSLMLSPALHYLANSQIPLFGSFPSAPPPAGPTVQLAGYGQFQGTVVNESLAGTEIQRPVTAWLGMPFAVPPTGKERFAVVGDPQPFDGVRKAQEYGDVCVQVGWPDPHTESEDCLSFNVFRPLDMPEEMEKLPVFVWVHGVRFALSVVRLGRGGEMHGVEGADVGVWCWCCRVASKLARRGPLMALRLWRRRRHRSLWSASTTGYAYTFLCVLNFHPFAMNYMHNGQES